jgi:hypothetical protein
MSTQTQTPTPPTAAHGLAPAKGAKRGTWIALGVTALVAAIAVIVLMRPSAPPDPKGDIVVVAKFAASGRFDDLTEKEKRPYMDALRFNIEKVSAAHKAGKLDDRQMKLANQYAWMARQLERMDEYYSLPPGKQREAYLDQRIDKKLAGGAKPKTEGSGKDDEFMEQWSQNWPRERQDRFEEYRDAMKARQKARGLTK